MVLLKALAKNPDDRYQTAEEFAHAIQRAIPDHPLHDSSLATQKVNFNKEDQQQSESVTRNKAESEIKEKNNLKKINRTKSLRLSFRIIGGLVLLSIFGFVALRILPGILQKPANIQAPVVSTSTSFATQIPATQQPVVQPLDFKVAEVTDMGGIDDKSFNAGAYAGITKAVADLGNEGKYLESTQQSDYAKNIQLLLGEDTDLIITVGFLMGVDTATAAKANPETKFAIVDYSYPDCFGDPADEGKTCGSTTELANVMGLTFSTDEAAFLAGYAAAASTQTGKVATFGGINIPPVTIFMKGFEAGVAYYNAQQGTAV